MPPEPQKALFKTKENSPEVSAFTPVIKCATQQEFLLL